MKRLAVYQDMIIINEFIEFRKKKKRLYDKDPPHPPTKNLQKKEDEIFPLACFFTNDIHMIPQRTKEKAYNKTPLSCLSH